MSAATDLIFLPYPSIRLLDNASLFIDFDGTLVDIADEPDGVIVSPEITLLLDRLSQRHAGRVALVSGRSIAQLDALLGPVATRIGLSGSHGSEHRWNDGFAHPVRSPSLNIAAARLKEIADRSPGAIVEEKSFGVALHYRLAPALEVDANAFARRIANDLELSVQEGKMMVEIRMPGGDKGTALIGMMRRPTMLGTHPVFIGDDLTDEAGFEAAHRLGGAGILVGTSRATCANFSLPNPAAVREWLFAAGLSGEGIL
jgi:trehalose 6-phosphate phosphatase